MRLYLIILLLSSSLGCSAQGTFRKAFAKADSFLLKRYNKIDYDTAFIGRSEGKIGLKLWGNVSGLSLRSNGNGIKTKLKTNEKTTLSFEFDYYDIALEMAINPASIKGKNKDYEANINYYGRRLSVDASYQMAKTMGGDIAGYGYEINVSKGWLDTRMFNLAAQYVFNYRRFSYDAPFYQLYRQKQSAGSWLAGISYQAGRVKTTSSMPANAPSARFYAGHFALGGGYAYNWVPNKKWLLHLSVIPNLIVWQGDNITFNGTRLKGHAKFPAVLMNERAAIVYFFNPRHFVGASTIVNSLIKRSGSTDFRQHKWLIRTYYGMRI